MAIISVLDSLNGKEITGDMLLIHADNIIGTQTSYIEFLKFLKLIESCIMPLFPIQEKGSTK